jgi:hypothetical protein
MRLRAYDTVHVSSVQAENIRPGQEFEISDSAGDDLLKAHPSLFAVVSRDAPEEKAAPAPENKAEPAPENKAAPIAAGPVSGPARRVPRG